MGQKIFRFLNCFSFFFFFLFNMIDDYEIIINLFLRITNFLWIWKVQNIFRKDKYLFFWALPILFLWEEFSIYVLFLLFLNYIDRPPYPTNYISLKSYCCFFDHWVSFWRQLLHNDHHQRIWTWGLEFKSLMRLYTFHLAFILLGKVGILSFFYLTL